MYTPFGRSRHSSGRRQPAILLSHNENFNMTTDLQPGDQMLRDTLMPNDLANVQIICIIGKSRLPTRY